MDRVSLINAYGKEQVNKKFEEIQRKSDDLKWGIERIKTFAPRFKEIYKVAVACLNNGIPLAPRDSLNDRKQNCFITNSWSHYVGLLGGVDYFSGKTTLREGFGKEGGGAFSWNLEINLEGEIEKLEGRTLDDEVRVVLGFVEGFDEFEKNFYEYVDKIVNK